MTPDEYLRDRLDDQINWYSKKSQWSQRCFKILRIVETVFASAIPFLVSLISGETPILKILTGAMGVCVAAISGLVSLYKFHENWIEYRTTAETLKHEKFLYLTKTPPYDGDNAFSDLVNRVESLISRENSTWSQTHREKEKEKTNG